MSVTDVGDEMCWRQLWDVGDGFGRFRSRNILSLNISVGYQHPKDVTNIEILSPTPENCYQHLPYVATILKLKRNISSECAEPPKFFNPEEGRSITAISSFPGSGNTWARHLLHMATGYWTGNRRGSNHLKQYGWMAEDINCRDRTTLAQKTHRLHHK